MSEPLRASLRIHRTSDDTVGEFVSVYTTLGQAQRALDDLRLAFGGRRVSSCRLETNDGAAYQVWCV